MGSRIKAVKNFLDRHRVFAMDTMIFIYHLEDHPKYAPVTQFLFDGWEKGTNSGITSMITLLELLVKPRMERNWEAMEDYHDLLLTYPNLQLVPVDEACANIASDLRARYGLKTPDAIQITSALIRSATAFVTNDGRLKKVKEIDVVLLDELLVG